MLAKHLKTILDARALVTPDPGHHVILEEKDVMEIEVFKLASDLVVIDLDRFGSYSGVKDGPWKKVCDYMLVYPDEDKDRIIFVELKKTLSINKRRAFEQLRRSLPLLNYLGSVCEIHFDASNRRKRKMSVRYVLIVKRINRRLDKQPIKPGQPLPSETHKGITVTPFVGSRVNCDRLWSG